MQPEQLIENGGDAIRLTKYYTGGSNSRRAERPASRFEKRYATAVIARLLTDLAAMQIHLTPEGMRWWAEEIERAGGDL